MKVDMDIIFKSIQSKFITNLYKIKFNYRFPLYRPS